jgi:hypothetical protein
MVKSLKGHSSNFLPLIFFIKHCPQGSDLLTKTFFNIVPIPSRGFDNQVIKDKHSAESVKPVSKSLDI